MTETPEAVAPPVIDPARWDEHEGFRETFLAMITHAGHNAALRGLGGMIHEQASELQRIFYRPPEGDVVHCLRAVVADLRYLTGYLEVHADARATTDEEYALLRLAWRKAASLKKVADALEEALNGGNGKNARKNTKTKKREAR
ncbi:MAG TPA: hypothetical protein DD490_04955 [Acidobacteria bacterium]|nr:hypothetical protein [Acidobacteriota bacterium]